MKKAKMSEDEKTIVKKPIVKIDLWKGIVERLKDEVVAEKSINLWIDDKLIFVFNCSPIKLKELTIGYLLSQGLVKSLQEIRRLQVSKEEVRVELRKSLENTSQVCKKDNVKKAFKFLECETIVNVSKKLNREATVYKKTGGTHAAALLTINGKVLVFSEDIGRHNAIDKVIGEAALKNINLKDKMLAITARVSSEIVMKAANVWVPVIISVSAPTNKGVEVAKKMGITLIGFARNKRFNIYAHSDRIRMQ